MFFYLVNVKDGGVEQGEPDRARRLFALLHFGDEIASKPSEFAKFDSLPNLSHGVKEERQIVMRKQNRT